ncbi:MAG: ABC transporter ATP-binding protein [Planctomycetota bacterium]
MLLRFENVSRDFGPVRALRSVSLSVRAGEIVALLGENGAGKSTLMHIVAGLDTPTAGRILIEDREQTIDSPRRAAALGIGLVSQHFALAPALTAAENYELFLRAAPRLYRKERIEERLSRDADEYGLPISSHRLVRDLAVGDRQRLEILKALGQSSRLLILDEPTAALTPAEFGELARVLRDLRSSGTAIVFISHKLSEVLQLADRIAILRQGELVGERSPADTDASELARLMVGEDLPPPLARDEHEPSSVRLCVRDLRVARERGRELHVPTLDLRGGEILGVAGIDGNGQDELFEALSGERTRTAETLEIEGQDARAWDVNQRARAGVGAIPGDRHRRGLVLGMTAAENLFLRGVPKGLTDLRPRLLRWIPGTLSRRRLIEHARPLLSRFRVRGDAASPVSSLSGGNQQKVVLARELLREPRILLAHSPTRGVDVAGAAFIHEQLARRRREGCAILLVSTDLDEILKLSDRIAVLSEGRWRGIPRGPGERTLLGHALGGAEVPDEGVKS